MRLIFWSHYSQQIIEMGLKGLPQTINFYSFMIKTFLKKQMKMPELTVQL